jgi:type I restriction enzyme S subunit
LGVRLWGEGAYERETIDGSGTKYAMLNRVEDGDLVVNKIWARSGSVAVVPHALSGCYVSGEFPIFAPIPSKVDSQWLHWLTKTKRFWGQCDEKSRGTSGKNRIRPEQFLSVTVPLPPIEEQRRIVERIEALAGKCGLARQLRKLALEEGKTLLRSVLHKMFVSDETVWPLSDVGSAAAIIDPNPSHRMPQYASEGISFISTVDFEGPEGIRKRTVKHVTQQTYLDQASRCSFSVGDIIYSRIGTIGEARVLTELWPFALSHVLVVVKPNPKVVLPRFLLWYLRSDSIVRQAESATRSIGVPDLGIKRIREFHMPLPRLEEQQQIVLYLDGLQTLIGKVRAFQTATESEIGSLMPSVLNQAFSGQL